MDKNELYESIQSGRLREAHYWTKWYGTYSTCLAIFQNINHTDKGDVPTRKFVIRKDDVSGSNNITRTHFVLLDLTPEEAIKVLNRVRENTYYVDVFNELEQKDLAV